MPIDPTSKFPLLASDQAEVMRIFLELMSERKASADQVSKAATDSSLWLSDDSDPSH